MKKNSTLLSGKSFAILFLSLSFIFISKSMLAQPASQTFNSSGTYTIPSGYSANVTIQAWGAGAGGGTNNSGPKGGGGSGAYASSTIVLTAGSYIVSIGNGGGAATGGGNSSFTTLVIAEGGFSTLNGTGGVGGTTAGSTGTSKIAGATGATISGNTGGTGGNGANSGGAGGAGATNNNSGTNGNQPGGGGGGKGGGTGNISGIGGGGRVVVTVNTVLPVKLSNIKAVEKQSGIQIDWTAYSEENLSKYQIERSANGSVFTVIGEVTARNSLTETKYDFFDSNPLQGVNFYRLKSIDIDAKYGFSNVLKINLDKRVKDITIYPNPVNGGYLSFQSAELPGGNYSVKVFNTAGQQVYNNRFTHNGGAISQTIQLPTGIKPGMYSMQLDNDVVKVMSKIFMKQ